LFEEATATTADAATATATDADADAATATDACAARRARRRRVTRRRSSVAARRVDRAEGPLLTGDGGDATREREKGRRANSYLHPSRECQSRARPKRPRSP
jgi:hypothetical protein